MPEFAVIIPAAGKGTRFLGPMSSVSADFSVKKPFVSLLGKPVWLYGVEQFAQIRDVVQTILVVAPEDIEGVRRSFDAELSRYRVETIAGGDERFESVENGLAFIRKEIDYVAIHDAARPCVTTRMIREVFRAAVESGAAVPATPIVGTIKRSGAAETFPAKKAETNGETDDPSLNNKSAANKTTENKTAGRDSLWIEKTISRERLWEAQTPQVFRKELYRDAVRRRNDFSPTDDAGLLERLGIPVRIVPADRTNIKITTPFDLKLAEKFLEMGASRS